MKKIIMASVLALAVLITFPLSPMLKWQKKAQFQVYTT